MAKAGKYIISAHATWIHESQDWKASFPFGNTANPSGRQVSRKLRPIKGKYLTGKPRPLSVELHFLNTFRMNLNYYYKSHLGDRGGSIGYFSPAKGCGFLRPLK